MSKKISGLFASTLVLILLSSLFSINVVSSQTTNADNEVVMTNSFELREGSSERIRTALELSRERDGRRVNDSEFEGGIPEACRDLGVSLEQRCRLLYNQVDRCLELADGTKSRCIMSAIGITPGQLRDADRDQNERREAARSYMFSLLEELNQRVRAAYARDAISLEDATILHEQIMVVQRMVLGGASRAEISAEMSTLRTEWARVF